MHPALNPPDHRLLFNIDANVWMYRFRRPSAFYRASGEKLTSGHIHRNVAVLAESGIDTLVINAHCTQLAYYPSKNVPTILDHYRRGDRSVLLGHILGWEMTPQQIEGFLTDTFCWMNAYVDLVEAGVDWLAETIKACRQHRISPWASIRMNDMHGATKHPESSFMNCELYKDPAMRLRGTTYNPGAPPQNGWQGFNYERREVRDYIMRAIFDMVENYDCEGLQLEWNRSPLCCEPPASQETADTITAWHGEVRRLTRRRSCALGIKFVGTLDQMRTIGLDLRAMASRGIIDYVSPTNFWQSSWDIPCDELKRELGPGVAVYGAIEMAPNWLHGYLPEQKKGSSHLGSPLAINYRLTPYSPPILRGNAAAKLALGVDGIEVYNFPCADQVSHWPWDDEPGCAQYAALRQLAERTSLRGSPKLYTLSSQVGYYQFLPFESVGPFPTVLGPGERRACRVSMCAEPPASGLEFVVQVVVRKTPTLPPVGVYLNGCWPNFDCNRDDRLLFPVANMTHHTPDHVGLNFIFPLASIRDGWNEVVVMNGEPKDFAADQAHACVSVVSLELAVRQT